MQFYGLIFAHWVGDFVVQTEWMAVNKSKSWKALGAHVAVYSVVLFVALLALNGWPVAANFTLVMRCSTLQRTRRSIRLGDTSPRARKAARSRERVIPISATTLAGMKTVSDLGIRPDVIYIDADQRSWAMIGTGKRFVTQ